MSDFLDYSNAFVSVVLRDYGESSAVAVAGVRMDSRSVLPEGSVSDRFKLERRTPVLDVIDLDRHHLETFESIIQKAAGIARHPRLGLTETELVVDVGVATDRALEVLSADDSVDAVPVTMTGERSVSYADGTYRVPRRDVIASLVMLTQRRLISIASGLEHGEALASGLSELSLVNVNHDAVDSLAMAVALAAWRMTNQFAPEDEWAEDASDGDFDLEPYDVANWGLSK